MIRNRIAPLALGAMLIAGAAWGADDCQYKGTSYSHGSAVCQSGTQYRCDDGQWSGLAVACTDNPPAAARNCAFNGSSFSPGSGSCQSGTQYRCDDGAWTSMAVACAASGQIAAQGPQEKRTCMYNGATVATESTICKSGVTFRCNDGEWLNLGSSCR